MIRYTVTIGLALILVMAATAGHAQEMLFHSREVGSYLPEETLIDANRDGKRADLLLLAGISDQLGQTTTHGVLEWPSDLIQGTCLNGKVGLEGRLVRGSAVTYVANGDLLLIWFDKGTSCFDDATHVTNITLEGSVVGGTGRFFDAIGTVEVTGITVPEGMPEGPGLSGFGSIDAEMTARIKMPRRHPRG